MSSWNKAISNFDMAAETNWKHEVIPDQGHLNIGHPLFGYINT